MSTIRSNKPETSGEPHKKLNDVLDLVPESMRETLVSAYEVAKAHYDITFFVQGRKIKRMDWIVKKKNEETSRDFDEYRDNDWEKLFHRMQFLQQGATKAALKNHPSQQ